MGHAVLPGVCLGFIVAGTRSTPAVMGGALLAGLTAAGLIALLRRTTPLKTGECTGVVFTGFYGLGIVLLKHIQTRADQFPGQAGLDRFLFGQIVGTSVADVGYMALMTTVVIASVMLFWRSLSVWAFDEGFARGLGLSVHGIELLVTALTTIAIVLSIQAVGVVLVAAMLVTPAATAYLLTDRLPRMVMLSAALGLSAGVLGAFFSLFAAGLPTGSLMVLVAAALFVLAFMLSPRHGLLPRVRRVRARRRRTAAEDFLRAIYLIIEKRTPDGRVRAAPDKRVGIRDFCADRQVTPAALRKNWRRAAARGWVDRNSRDPIILTPEGLAEARRIVRNHRLWELFLTQEANLASDHVHADAEEIEHILPQAVLQKLEQMLDHPIADPHGKPIP